MNKSESQHNTPEQVRLYLAAALEIVELVDPPAELREVCFAKAVDLCSAKQIFYEQLPTLAGLRNH